MSNLFTNVEAGSNPCCLLCPNYFIRQIVQFHVNQSLVKRCNYFLLKFKIVSIESWDIFCIVTKFLLHNIGSQCKLKEKSGRQFEL